VLRDKLLARLREMGGAVDHRRLAREVLGIRGASEAMARRLVSQALVVEDRREAWRRNGDRICGSAPPTPAVYVLRDEAGLPLYVGKAVNLRRRLRSHFADRRWRAIKPALAAATDVEWIAVGSELEALLREADLIQTLSPLVNVQVRVAEAHERALPASWVRDVIVVLPSIELDSAELLGARVDGGWMIQRTRRNGADLAVHAKRLRKFFSVSSNATGKEASGGRRLAPIVFSWLRHRGASATRIDPWDAASARQLAARLAAVVGDERLFAERLVIYS
jgi:hypothetical protein